MATGDGTCEVEGFHLSQNSEEHCLAAVVISAQAAGGQ
jgi:hypothetical protein